MKFSSSKTMWLVALLAVLATPFAAIAQTVENNQDEVVNIVGAGNVEGNDNVLKIFRPADKIESLNYVTEIVALKYAASMPRLLRSTRRSRPDAASPVFATSRS